ncbi:hypothetical protein ACIA5C_05930 [Actinoplanes sp. NPDC051343]|jgi:hypothetical protein|uniref:hypothetical protein n=1 Tax=Actinoplanes sp. NPDC051343 TaxID=3363906 RepID=UPI0037A83F83
MKAILSLGDRMLSALLPKSSADALSCSQCSVSTYLLGEPGCQWYCTRTCPKGSGCASKSYCC